MNSLVGQKFRAAVNGKRSINGADYSHEFWGTIEETEGPATIYEAMKRIIGYAEEQNKDMEYPESMEVCFGLDDDEAA